MELQRQNIKTARVADLVTAKFSAGDRETFRPGSVTTRFGEKISRTKVVGVVTERFMSDDGRFASITVDDGTDAIRARVFSGDIKIIEGVNAGELVAVVGKMKSYNEENYIAPDFVRRLEDPNSESLFRLEVLENLFQKKKVRDELRALRDQMSEEEFQQYAEEKYGIGKETLGAMLEIKGAEVDYRPMVMEIIDGLDQGKGVEIGKLLEASKLDESVAESTISGLIASGELYEPTVGRLRRVTA